jgi:hypothetical protein
MKLGSQFWSQFLGGSCLPDRGADRLRPRIHTAMHPPGRQPLLLRIKRLQVRILPGAPLQAPELLGFLALFSTQPVGNEPPCSNACSNAVFRSDPDSVRECVCGCPRGVVADVAGLPVDQNSAGRWAIELPATAEPTAGLCRELAPAQLS